MAEFTLPKNSKITVGKTWPKPSGVIPAEACLTNAPFARDELR